MEKTASDALGFTNSSKVLLRSNQGTKIYSVTPTFVSQAKIASENSKSTPPGLILKSSLYNIQEGEMHEKASTLSKHVVKHLGSYASSKKNYILMERCKESLAESIRSRRQESKYWSTIKIVKAMKNLSKALWKLHEGKIVHRDIKSDNIYLTEDDSVKLGDFGNSQISRASNSNVYGTLSYLAPEMGTGHDFFKSDVWALGKTFFEMCSLELYLELDEFFHDENKMVAVMKNKLRDTNKRIVEIIQDMMRVSPSRRIDAYTAYIKTRDFYRELVGKINSKNPVRNEKLSLAGEIDIDFIGDSINLFDSIPMNLVNEDNLSVVNLF